MTNRSIDEPGANVTIDQAATASGSEPARNLSPDADLKAECAEAGEGAMGDSPTNAATFHEEALRRSERLAGYLKRARSGLLEAHEALMQRDEEFSACLDEIRRAGQPPGASDRKTSGDGEKGRVDSPHARTRVPSGPRRLISALAARMTRGS